MSIFSDRLTNIREEHNFSKTKVASLVGVSLSRYANWEYGYNDPDMATLTKLATALDTTTDYLTGRTDNPAQPTKMESTSADLDEMLDNARSFDGKPMSQHDRDVIRSYLQGRFSE